MRQTSKAVLLLLSAASAAEVAPAFGVKQPAITATTLENQGKWQGYIGKPVYSNLTDANALTTVVIMSTTGTAKANVTNGTMSCITCIKGKVTTKRTVWCSAAWNYEYTALALDKTYPDTKANGEQTWSTKSVDTGASAYTAGDRGACCYTADTFLTMIDIAANDETGATAGKNDLFNKWTCPAKFTNDHAAAGKVKAMTVALSAKNWWCSDGTWNMKNDTDYHTKGATYIDSNQAAFQPNTGSNKLQDKSKILPNDYTLDRRNELFYAQCRQKNKLCGGASHVDEATATSTGTAAKRAIDFSANGFSAEEKCTWVLRSKTKAPSFTITNATGGTNTKFLTEKVDVVYQEWVDGWQIAEGTDFIAGYDGTTAYTSGGVPNAAMANANYIKAYKFNYNTRAENFGSPFGDAWNYNTQRAGEAWVYQSRDLGCTAGATTGADKNEAASPATDASCFANKTAKRWIGSLDVSGPTHTNAVKDAYDSALSTFNTNAASYNKYLADLKTANEKDAFSAFFSPPKKPAMVKRPGAPTKPAAYTGLAHWPAADQATFYGATTNAPKTNGKQFVLGNNLNGGWGAWTISRLTGTGSTTAATDLATNKISHSFGMLGVSQEATARLGWGYLKNWQKDNVATHTTTAALALTNTVSPMCATATKSATHLCIPKGSTTTAANAKYVYLNVSVWANQALTAGNYASEITVQFYASSWADGKAYYAPAAAADGTALTEPAGAHALAASAAAVVAVAAALY